jgi:hypothetical protein
VSEEGGAVAAPLSCAQLNLGESQVVVDREMGEGRHPAPSLRPTPSRRMCFADLSPAAQLLDAHVHQVFHGLVLVAIRAR